MRVFLNKKSLNHSNKIKNLICIYNASSCWAFATVGAIEAALKIKKNITVDLSEQKLVDCAADYYNDRGGCSGFIVSDTFDYVVDKSLPLESASPYAARVVCFISFLL